MLENTVTSILTQKLATKVHLKTKQIEENTKFVSEQEKRGKFLGSFKLSQNHVTGGNGNIGSCVGCISG